MVSSGKGQTMAPKTSGEVGVNIDCYSQSTTDRAATTKRSQKINHPVNQPINSSQRPALWGSRDISGTKKSLNGWPCPALSPLYSLHHVSVAIYINRTQFLAARLYQNRQIQKKRLRWSCVVRVGSCGRSSHAAYTLLWTSPLRPLSAYIDICILQKSIPHAHFTHINLHMMTDWLNRLTTTLRIWRSSICTRRTYIESNSLLEDICFCLFCKCIYIDRVAEIP